MECKFLCCGDALFDLFAEPSESIGAISLNGHVGGSPLNVAVGLARLGNQSGYLYKNSNDLFGKRIAAYLAANGVLPDWRLPSTLNSTLAIVTTDSRGSPSYAFYTENTADLSISLSELPVALPDSIEVVHVGSYSTAVDPTAAALLELVRREKSRRVISYDPNIRLAIEPDIDVWKERFSALLACADFVKASDEDIQALFGSSCSSDTFAADAISAGASLVIVTRGGDGAEAYSSDGRQVSTGGVNVDIVDTVGAGDTFQAATLHWLYTNQLIQAGQIKIEDVHLPELLEFAAFAAGVTCSRKGADLPTLEDLKR